MWWCRSLRVLLVTARSSIRSITIGLRVWFQLLSKLGTAHQGLCKTLLSSYVSINSFSPSLSDCADKVVSGDGKFEALIVNSKDIAASTAQLVNECRTIFIMIEMTTDSRRLLPPWSRLGLAVRGSKLWRLLLEQVLHVMWWSCDLCTRVSCVVSEATGTVVASAQSGADIKAEGMWSTLFLFIPFFLIPSPLSLSLSLSFQLPTKLTFQNSASTKPNVMKWSPR